MALPNWHIVYKKFTKSFVKGSSLEIEIARNRSPTQIINFIKETEKVDRVDFKVIVDDKEQRLLVWSSRKILDFI